jgi:hypothetical protein
MEGRWMVAVTAALALALSLGGCRAFRQPYVPLPVGTCVRASDAGTATVPCADPHTHRVSANVAGDGAACPPDTVMYASPADPDDGLLTTCFRADTTPE